jgi:hypothetical protein
MTEVLLQLLEELLNLFGAMVGFSLAYIGYEGYRGTGSPTLLRLSLAFGLLGGAFLLSGVLGLAQLGMLPALPLILSLLLLMAAALETLGYFFLAFSYIVNVRSSRMTLPALLVGGGAFTVTAALKSLSLFFLFYGVVEILMAYWQRKNPRTFLIGLGLILLAIGELTRWISLFYPGVTAILLGAIVLKLSGLASLFLPVMTLSPKV